MSSNESENSDNYMTFQSFNQIYLFSQLKLKEYFRMNKILLISGLAFSASILLMYGVINLIVFKEGSAKFFQGYPNLLFRDALANIILVVYLSILVYSLLKAVTGVANPFINSHKDVNFQLLVPVNPFVAFFSIKIQNIFKNSIIVAIVVLFFLGPLILFLQISLIRIIPFFLNFLLGIELVSLISNIFFFLGNFLRSGKQWGVIFTEKNNVFVNMSLLVVPLIFYQLYIQLQLPSFNLLCNFIYIPFINVAVSNTGLLFRSGVPISSYFGFISCFVEVMILIIINVILIRLLSSTTELGDILPIMENLQSTKEILLTPNEGLNSIPSITKVEKNELFDLSRDEFSLIKKELLLINRSSDLKLNIAQMILIPIAVLLFFFLNLESYSFALVIVGLLTIQLITVEIDTLSKLYHSISSNKRILAIENSKLLNVSIFVTFVFSVPIFILILPHFNILSIFLLPSIWLVSYILKTLKINNTTVNLYISVFILSLFVNVIFPV